jgi:hypothetical protein
MCVFTSVSGDVLFPSPFTGQKKGRRQPAHLVFSKNYYFSMMPRSFLKDFLLALDDGLMGYSDFCGAVANGALFIKQSANKGFFVRSQLVQSCGEKFKFELVLHKAGHAGWVGIIKPVFGKPVQRKHTACPLPAAFTAVAFAAFVPPLPVLTMHRFSRS